MLSTRWKVLSAPAVVVAATAVVGVVVLRDGGAAERAAPSTAARPVVEENRLVDARSGRDFVPRGVNWSSFEYACAQGWGLSSLATLVARDPLAHEAAAIAGWGEDHVESGSLDYDGVEDVIGPVDLPRNGMVRLRYTVDDGRGGTRERWFYLSSYMVVNNDKHPELNVCEVAVGGVADQRPAPPPRVEVRSQPLCGLRCERSEARNPRHPGGHPPEDEVSLVE